MAAQDILSRALVAQVFRQVMRGRDLHVKDASRLIENYGVGPCRVGVRAPRARQFERLIGGERVSDSYLELAARALEIRTDWIAAEVARRMAAIQWFLAKRDAFVNRTCERGEVADALESGESLIIVGHAGVGKSRLAAEYVRSSLLRWTGGIWCCNLTAVKTAQGLFTALASCLDLSVTRGNAESIADALSKRKDSLIVLDGVDGLVDEARSVLTEWLMRCTLLVTCSHAILTDRLRIKCLDSLNPGGAGALLLQKRARECGAPRIPRRDAQSFAQLVEGNPHAIELVALAARDSSYEEVRQQFVASSQAATRALVEMVALSVDNLSESARRVLYQATVFDGSFTEEAACEVLEPVVDGADYAVMRASIAELVAARLLSFTTEPDQPRYALYEHVRPAAIQGLRRVVPDPIVLERRHGKFFARLGRPDAVDALSRPGGVAQRSKLRSELRNLMSACQRAVLRRDTLVAMNAFAASWEVLRIHGPFDIGAWLGRGVLEIFEPEGPDKARGHLCLGHALQLSGSTVEAADHYTAAVRIGRNAGDRRSEGVALRFLGVLKNEQGSSDEARVALTQACAILSQAGHACEEAVALHALGDLHLQVNEFAEAKDKLLEAEALYAAVGDERGLAHIAGNIGNFCQKQSEFDAARSRYAEALERHIRNGDRRGEAMVLSDLGSLFYQLQMIDQARKHLEESSVLHRNIGNPRGEAKALGGLALCLEALGLIEEAGRQYEEALRMNRKIGNRPSTAIVLVNQADFFRNQGLRESAQMAAAEAVEIFTAIGDGRSAAYARRLVAEIGA